jgi:hypothetical protein
MARDGSSGGVIRMAVITEDGVERLFVPGNELPTFWEGLEVLAANQPSNQVSSPWPLSHCNLNVYRTVDIEYTECPRSHFLLGLYYTRKSKV